MTLRYGSLFSGIGGFDLGLDRAGMECAWQVEILLYRRQVLAKHWPDVPKFKDVHHVGRHNLLPVDLICGGFPCQPHSLAGQRRGAADDRNLWPEYRRIVGELRPRWVLAENVPGIRTTILDQVLSDLEGLDYTVRTLDLPAVAFDAWHRRHRIFIVAHRNSAGCDRQSVPISVGNEPRTNYLDTGRDGALIAHPDGSSRNGRADEQIGQSQGGIAAWRSSAPTANLEKPGLADGRSGRLGEDAEEKQWNMAQPGFERRDSRAWAPEPDVARVVHGLPSRLDRYRNKQRIGGLGDAVVPAVAQFLGELVFAADSEGGAVP